jgi:hypothetical protein
MRRVRQNTYRRLLPRNLLSAMSTCTAPGHPSCTITCPQGCGAIYDEPNGPCNTFCADSITEALTFGSGSKYSIEFNELPAAALSKLLGGALAAELGQKVARSSANISLKLQSCSIQELLNAIEQRV